MPSTLCANPGGDAASIATGLPDFTGPGPCAVAADTGIPVTLPPSSGCGDDCFLEMHLTAPSAPSQRSAANACPFAAPYPVLFLYPGFQLRASFYGGYAERLASWGLAVVRYDTRLLDFVPAGVQTGYVTHLLEALAAINSDPSSQWHQRLDLSRLGAAGHSRGGKLAALHLASRTPPLFTTAYLIDPVDSHGGEDDPSAVEALRGRGQRFGIAAAGVVGPCNPKDRTRGFWQVAGPGSWRETVLRGGHAQFCNISNWLVEHALDALCGRGNDTHQAVVQLTLPPMTAWLHQALGARGEPQRQPLPLQEPPYWGARQLWRLLRTRLSPPDAAPRPLLREGGAVVRRTLSSAGSLDGPFWDWVQTEEQLGEITFDVKE